MTHIWYAHARRPRPCQCNGDSHSRRNSHKGDTQSQCACATALAGRRSCARVAGIDVHQRNTVDGNRLASAYALYVSLIGMTTTGQNTHHVH